jgi:hydrogenase expression/formation protein HypE
VNWDKTQHNVRMTPTFRRNGTVSVPKITLAHGGGGRAMRDLVDDVFISCFDSPQLAKLDDQARLDLNDLARGGDRLAFTTDSFVVDPLEFPGGDIGKLAVCGTINDLAVGGARPLYLSCAVIIEEGLEVDLLRRLAHSMARTAAQAGVQIITGDTKVVGRGACDKLFITTSGVGVIRAGLDTGPHQICPGDAVIVSGWLGDHGAAILNARGDLALSTTIASDCAPLNQLIEGLISACPDVRFIRDLTRGGLASAVNEVAEAAGLAIEIDEASIPVRPEVRGMCELLGLDPLYLANEGKVVCIVAPEAIKSALAALQLHPIAAKAAVIGHVVNEPAGRVTAQTAFGGWRILDMLVGEQLPRIC